MWKIEATALCKDGAVIVGKLRPTEMRILDCFIRHPNEIMSAEQIAIKIGSKSPDYIRDLMSRFISSNKGLPLEALKGKRWEWRVSTPNTEKQENNFCVFPALGYWEIDGKPVSSLKANYGANPKAVWRETEVAKNMKESEVEKP